MEHWDIMTPRPHLALSVIGGAKNFKLDGRKKVAFKTGLISAARLVLPQFCRGVRFVSS